LLAYGLLEVRRDDEKPAGFHDQRLKRLIQSVERAVGRLGEPDVDALEKVHRRPAWPFIRPRLIVKAQASGEFHRPPVDMGYHREVLSQGQHFGMNLVVIAKHDGDSFPPTDVVVELLGPLGFDVEYDHVSRRIDLAPDLSQGHECVPAHALQILGEPDTFWGS
jgi:hypothetical protein